MSIKGKGKKQKRRVNQSLNNVQPVGQSSASGAQAQPPPKKHKTTVEEIPDEDALAPINPHIEKTNSHAGATIPNTEQVRAVVCIHSPIVDQERH